MGRAARGRRSGPGFLLKVLLLSSRSFGDLLRRLARPYFPDSDQDAHLSEEEHRPRYGREHSCANERRGPSGEDQGIHENHRQTPPAPEPGWWWAAKQPSKERNPGDQPDPSLVD